MKLNFFRPSLSGFSPNGKINITPQSLVNSINDFDTDQYICVSYAWGDQLIEHPLYSKNVISVRTLNVLSTAVLAVQNIPDTAIASIENFWLDSLCIPDEYNDNEDNYSMLGEIFAKAEAAIVILSSKIAPVLEKITQKTDLNEQDFNLLNKEPWVSRYWTYQEIVNTRKTYFVAENHVTHIVFGIDFFDVIAKSIEKYCREHNKSSFAFLKKYLYLTSLEAVILDWRLADYQDRSVYQVMVNMEYRHGSHKESKLISMFGCLSTNLISLVAEIHDDYERFMQICHKANDYSYIFNTSTNRKVEAQKWLPLTYDFEPIYKWLYLWGEGQKGILHNDRLELQNIVMEYQNNFNEDAVNYISSILNNYKKVTSGQLLKIMQKNLVSLGFKGNLTPIRTTNGFYFDQFPRDSDPNLIVVVAGGVEWTYGAPAILVKPSASKEHTFDFLSAGVFFGQISKTKSTINID